MGDAWQVHWARYHTNTALLVCAVVVAVGCRCGYAFGQNTPCGAWIMLKESEYHTHGILGPIRTVEIELHACGRGKCVPAGNMPLFGMHPWLLRTPYAWLNARALGLG